MVLNAILASLWHIWAMPYNDYVALKNASAHTHSANTEFLLGPGGLDTVPDAGCSAVSKTKSYLVVFTFCVYRYVVG